jgi:adenylate cyclase
MTNKNARKHWRLPISVKLIGIFVAFLTVATVIFARQSADLFTKVLVQREEFSNITEATSRASEIDQLMTNLLDRTQVLGQLLFKSVEKTSPENPQVELSNEFLLNFDKDKSVMSLEIWKLENHKPTLLYRKTKDRFLEENKLASDYINLIRSGQNFPVTSVFQKNRELRSASQSTGVALATLGIPIAQTGVDQVSHILLADFALSPLQKLFSGESERTQFLVDRNGVLLAHPDETKVLNRESLAKAEFVAKALSDPQPRRQVQFQDPQTKEDFIGAYVKLPSLGLTIFSQTSKNLILEPALHVKRQAFYIAGVVISVAILMIFLFSMTLTGPIEVLVKLVRQVAEGDFEIKAGSKIKSLIEDEVHELAHAFDKMTEGLKERDKVKSLFSKFHGSSVAEDLMKNEIGVGGQNKEVTVFFSDIRGFTSYAENRTPEEVVSMLNDYFEVMVAIINRHGGVVDKFIGDAIMAVWGAPKETSQDTENAVRACIEMRRSLVELNDRQKAKGRPPILIGMGLHTGRAISGTIGSHERMEYTVIGDTVNMTSRIESSTKAFGTDFLVSQSVMDKVQDKFLVEMAGKATVKGKAEPLNLYYVRGYKDESGKPIVIDTEYCRLEKELDEKTKAS